ncbi:hypothetical protein [Crocosphaera sp.]|uniref:hypothetical protein n=1 Tax=Crocosphaera sp. TaxID=2729996 RepID=UPI0026151E19|nr:hypothetical protein [Crocosphaera sp.]MDJ0580604.1 hypothetical protein [Crocosphaera sp.]
MNYKIDSIKILRMNQVYRVTDLVFCRGIRWQEDRETILCDPRYRETILYSYLTQKRYEKDLETFERVVRDHRLKYEKPSPDSLVIHLRLGDVMDDINGRPLYGKSRKIYHDLDLIGLPSLKHTTIVTALHFGANPMNNKYFYSDIAKERSFEIFQLLSDTLKVQGLEVACKSTENIDEDLCFMSGSKYFVKGLSRFSDLVATCMDNGSLIWSPEGGQPYKKTRINSFTRQAKSEMSRLYYFLKNYVS